MTIDPSTVSTCYGMAENVFAVTQSQGMVIRTIDGARVVGCGPPIPGTDVRAVNGELQVRSLTSVRSYIGTGEIVDDQGYYATGDMGHVLNGDVFVVGRTRDVMISAGQKYLLNDLDHLLNRLVPDCRGRGAVLADEDPTLPGTQKPLCLLRTTTILGG